MVDPVQQMLACHARMREFTRGLGRLAALDDLRDPRAPDAAERCRRYFREGLPLHALDEDVSLAPRLRGVRPGTQVEDALYRIEDEHDRIEAVIADLLPLLGAIHDTAPHASARHTRPSPPCSSPTWSSRRP